MADAKRSFLEPAVLARLLPLPLHARHAMLGSVSGKHRSPVRGSSLEFALPKVSVVPFMKDG